LPPEQVRRLAALDGISHASWLARRIRILRSGLRPATALDAQDYLIKR
jgi:hypothetical protein